MTYDGNTGTSFSVMEEQPLTLTATPANSDVSFVKWTKGGVDISTENPYTFNLPDGSGNDTYTAVFVSSDDHFAMEALRFPEIGGNVTPATSTTYNGNATCNFTATPNPEWDFVGWFDENENQLSGVTTSGNSYTYTISRVVEDRTLTARFTHQPFRIAYSVNPAEGGSVSVSGANASGTYDFESNPVLTASANENYRFQRWSGDISSTANPYTIRSISSHYDNIVANFVRTYTLTASANNGGTVTITPSVAAHDGRYDAGTSITVEASEVSGYVFDFWTVDGVDVASATSRSYRIDGIDHDMTLVANYKPVYRLRLYTAPVINNAILTGAGNAYRAGSEVSVKVSGFDASRYNFQNWTDASGNVVSSTAEFTYTINANTDLTANFEINIPSYSVTVQTEGEGQVLNSGSVMISSSFVEGTVLSLSTRPAEGYHFVRWEINGVSSQEATLSYTVNGATNIKAYFAQSTSHTVTVVIDPDNNPLLRVLGLNRNGLYADGERLTVVASADNNSGYEFLGWFVDGRFHSTSPTYTNPAVHSSFTLTAVFNPLHVSGADVDYLLYNDESKTTVTGVREEYRNVITTVTIPSTVNTIAAQAFANCTSLTHLEIPTTVETIGNYAFSGCSSLRAVAIPASVTSLGTYMFNNCSALQSVSLPTGLTSLPEGLFYGCSAMSAVTIPAGVETIGSFAFSGCSAIYTLDIPASVTSVGAQAFSSMSGLRFVNLNAGIQSFGANCFQGSNAIVSTSFNGTLEQWLDIDFADANAQPVTRSRNLAINGEMLTELVVPAGTETIKPFAFYNDTLLTTITLPASVTTIENNAFARLSNLERIELNSLPANVHDEAFASVDKENVVVSVPCSLYAANLSWAGFSNFVVNGMPTLTVTQRPGGIVMINNVPSCTDADFSYLITAKAGSNYEFLSWSDGNADNPRTITLTEDMNLSPVWKRNEEIQPCISSYYGFENAQDIASWYSLNNGANQWFVGDATANSQALGGTKSLYVSNDQGITNAYDAASSPYVFTELYLLSGVYEIRYDYKVGGEDGDYLSAALIPDNGDYANLSTTSEGAVVLADGVYGTENTSASWLANSRLVEVQTPGWYQLAFFWNADEDAEVFNPAAAIDNIFVNYQTPDNLQSRFVNVNVATNNETMGTAYVGETPGTTSKLFLYGQDVTIHAVVSNPQLYRFVRWSDGDTSANRIINFIDIYNVNPYYTAIFEAIPDYYTVTVGIQEGAEDAALQFGVDVNGSIQREANISFNQDATVKLNLPQEGWAFMGWSNGTEIVSTDNPYTYRGRTDATLIAMMKEWRPCAEYGDEDYTVRPGSIFDYDITDLNAPTVSNIRVFVENDQIVIAEANGLEVTLYDVNGRKLASKVENGRDVRFDVPASGSYMVKVQDLLTRKVVVVK